MARHPRIDIANEIYHVINRSNARLRIFKSSKDYQSVLDTLVETLEISPLDIFAFCLMPNHWHFVVRPAQNGDMGRFFGKFTQKVTQRWHASHQTIGSGHLFQGRFKSFLVERDEYFLQLTKYVETNALRAKLVNRAEEWRWGSLNIRETNLALSKVLLKPWPLDEPKDYVASANISFSKPILKNIQNCVIHNRPLGDNDWVERIVREYDLGHTTRSVGRPRKN